LRGERRVGNRSQCAAGAQAPTSSSLSSRLFFISSSFFRGHRPTSKTTVFQTDDAGAIPAVRSTGSLRVRCCCLPFDFPNFRGHRPRVRPQSSKLMMRVRFPLSAPFASRFSGEDRRLQHGARGFDSLSALYDTRHSDRRGSRRVGYPELSDKEFAPCSIHG
jgi:hypothetical protein